MTTIIEDVKLDFQDVLLLPKRSTLDSRSKVKLERQYKFKHSAMSYKGIPIVGANMDTIGTMKMAKTFHPYGMSVALHKFYPVDKLVEFFKTPESANTFYTTGISDEELVKFNKVREQLGTNCQPPYICVDVANGYSRKLAHFVEKLREKCPGALIMAGNVVTPDMVYDLLERGADIVKVGIGPGSVCTTRRITGVGYPQLSAIMECADAAHGTNGHICGDGGVTCPGDIVKAFAGGADFVMCGGIFAGYEECEGDIVGELLPMEEFEYKEQEGMDPTTYISTVHSSMKHKRTGETVFTRFDKDTRKCLHQDPFPPSFFKPGAKMKFYGMSSEEAMEKHYGGKADYRAGEGKVVEVPFKGSVSTIVEEILGGLRSACTYIGASELKNLAKCATLIRVSRQLNNVFGEQK